MTTIIEDYVSFEIAKLLKEKGFDEGCHSFYDYAQRLQFIESVIYDSELSEEDNECVAPTLQMAMKWLREVYGIYVVFFHTDRSGWWFNISDMKDSYVLYMSEKTKRSFEEICEAAIKYCLENLI